MAKNKMEDLRDHLFEALERIKDEDLKPEELEKEIKKAKVICEVSEKIIDTAKVEIDFIKVIGADGTDSQLFKSIHETKQLP